MSKPIVFLLGPSGAGKTTLGDALANEFQMLHTLFDGHPEGDGVDVANLRAEWKTLLEARNPQPLADEVRRRIDASGHSGAVISCSSGIMPAEDQKAARWHFPRSLVTAMSLNDVRCAVLIGPLAACMDAAIHREGSGVTTQSWLRDNSNWMEFQRDSFPECVLDAFGDGKRRPVDDLVREFQERFMP